LAERHWDGKPVAGVERRRVGRRPIGSVWPTSPGGEGGYLAHRALPLISFQQEQAARLKSGDFGPL